MSISAADEDTIKSLKAVINLIEKGEAITLERQVSGHGNKILTIKLIVE